MKTLKISILAITMFTCCKPKPITTNSDNTFSCTIDGKSYTMNKPFVFNNLTCSEGNSVEDGAYLHIMSYGCKTFSFDFFVKNVVTDSILNFKTPNNGNSLSINSYPSTSITSRDTLISSIKFNEYSTHRIKGTFGGQFINIDNGKIVTITNGQFNIPY